MENMNIKDIMGEQTRSLLSAMESSNFLNCDTAHIILRTPDGKENRFQRLTRWEMVENLVNRVNAKHKEAASLVGTPPTYFPDAMRGQRALPRNTVLSLLLVTQNMAENDPDCLSHIVLNVEPEKIDIVDMKDTDNKDAEDVENHWTREEVEDIENSWNRTAAPYTAPWSADIAEVQHILMVARVAGLYRNQSLEDSRRNLVLQHLFTWKREYPELFRDLAFSEYVLKACGCKPLKPGRSYTPPKIKKKLFLQIQTLQEDLKQIKRVDAFRRRSALCCGYFGVSSIEEISAKNRIALDLECDWEHSPDKLDLFLKEDRNTTSVLTPKNREALIHFALTMGAGYEDLQRMLIEAGCAVLYPRSYDDWDLAYIRLAMENDKQAGRV